MKKFTQKTVLMLWVCLAAATVNAQNQSGYTCPDSTLSNRWYRNLYAVGNAYWAATTPGLTAAKKLAETAAQHGFNGVVVPMHFFFMSWDQTTKNNFQSYVSYCQDIGLDVIPEVFRINSGGVVYNRNFAEADPDRITLVAETGSLRPVTPAGNYVLNGGLENYTGHKFSQYQFNDKPGVCTFADNVEKNQGNASIRFENFAANNGTVRLSQNIGLQPNRHYRFKFMLKKNNFPGQVTAQIYGKNYMNRIQDFSVRSNEPNTPWTQYSFEFSTSDTPDIRFYIGTWSGSGSGRFWIDDIEITELASLSNIVRRTGTPLSVKSLDGSITYTEGVDFEYIANKHVLPSIAIPPGSGILNNQQVVLSCYRMADFNGQKAMCMTHEGIYPYFSNMMREIYALYNFKKVFLYIDEIRIAGSCLECKNSGKSTAQILGDCTTRLYDSLKTIDPLVEVLTWADMFDPNWNAKNHYFKVVGDLTGSWNYIPKEMTIVPWGNPGDIGSTKYTFLKNSMDHFIDNGFNKLIGAGYYDTRSLTGTASWIKLLSGYTQSKGLIYTTWRTPPDFSQLSGFGDMMMDSIHSGTRPVAPEASSVSICSGGKATLIVNNPAADINYEWYDAQNGGTLLFTGSSFTTSELTSTTVYYVQSNIGGCGSPRTAVTATVHSLPSPLIRVSRSDNTLTKLDDRTIALGYGAQVLTLTASDENALSGTVTYSWSPAVGLSDATLANPVFGPTTAGVYRFTVTVSNEFGCSDTAGVTITVIDVRCGNKNDKVSVCHTTHSKSGPGNSLCISPDDVADHLNHGDELGACDTSSGLMGDAVGTVSLRAYPNPFNTQAAAEFTIPVYEQKVTLDLYTYQGVRLKRLYDGKAEAGQTYTVEFKVSSFSPEKYYFLRLTTSQDIHIFKMITD